VLVSKLTRGTGHHIFIHDRNGGGSLGDQDLTQPVHRVFQDQENQVVIADNVQYFLQIFPCRDHLLIIGAAHISIDLIRLAHEFGFKSTVIDPRGLFTQSLEKWVRPDQIIKSWPEEALSTVQLDAYTYAVVLTHDPKIDDEALKILLESDVAYIGALGSKRTHEKRLSRLREMGFSEKLLDRIRGPVGVDIGAKEPREIALSILAEIIKIKRTSKVL